MAEFSDFSRLIGKTLNEQIVVDELLGEGGMGVTFRGRQEGLNRDVCVKFLKTQHVTDIEKFQRFKREALVLARLKHRNIVSCYSLGLYEGVYPYIVVELVRGKSLRTLMASERLPWRKALAICIQVCRALAFSHRQGFVHRDVKPENIMIETVDQEEVVKLIDFGLVGLFDYEQITIQTITSTGDIMGSVHYMPPESFVQASPASSRDIYSVGVLLYELLAGSPPFDSYNSVAIMNMHIKSEVPPLPRGSVPDWAIREINGIIARAMSKKPEHRHETADDIADSLQYVLDHNEHDSPATLTSISASEESAMPRLIMRSLSVPLRLVLASLGLLAICACLRIDEVRWSILHCNLLFEPEESVAAEVDALKTRHCWSEAAFVVSTNASRAFKRRDVFDYLCDFSGQAMQESNIIEALNCLNAAVENLVVSELPDLQADVKRRNAVVEMIEQRLHPIVTSIGSLNYESSSTHFSRLDLLFNNLSKIRDQLSEVKPPTANGVLFKLVNCQIDLLTTTRRLHTSAVLMERVHAEGFEALTRLSSYFSLKETPSVTRDALTSFATYFAGKFGLSSEATAIRTAWLIERLRPVILAACGNQPGSLYSTYVTHMNGLALADRGVPTLASQVSIMRLIDKKYLYESLAHIEQRSGRTDSAAAIVKEVWQSRKRRGISSADELELVFLLVRCGDPATALQLLDTVGKASLNDNIRVQTRLAIIAIHLQKYLDTENSASINKAVQLLDQLVATPQWQRLDLPSATLLDGRSAVDIAVRVYLSKGLEQIRQGCGVSSEAATALRKARSLLRKGKRFDLFAAYWDSYFCHTPVEGLEYAEQALEHARSTSCQLPWLAGKAEFELGSAYVSKRDYKTGYSHCRRGLEFELRRLERGMNSVLRPRAVNDQQLSSRFERVLVGDISGALALLEHSERTKLHRPEPSTSSHELKPDEGVERQVLSWLGRLAMLGDLSGALALSRGYAKVTGRNNSTLSKLMTTFLYMQDYRRHGDASSIDTAVRLLHELVSTPEWSLIKADEALVDGVSASEVAAWVCLEKARHLYVQPRADREQVVKLLREAQSYLLRGTNYDRFPDFWNYFHSTFPEEGLEYAQQGLKNGLSLVWSSYLAERAEMALGEALISKGEDKVGCLHYRRGCQRQIQRLEETVKKSKIESTEGFRKDMHRDIRFFVRVLALPGHLSDALDLWQEYAGVLHRTKLFDGATSARHTLERAGIYQQYGEGNAANREAAQDQAYAILTELMKSASWMRLLKEDRQRYARVSCPSALAIARTIIISQLLLEERRNRQDRIRELTQLAADLFLDDYNPPPTSTSAISAKTFELLSKSIDPAFYIEHHSRIWKKETSGPYRELLDAYLLGHAYWRLHDEKHAREHFHRAVRIAAEPFGPNSPARLPRISCLYGPEYFIDSFRQMKFHSLAIELENSLRTTQP